MNYLPTLSIYIYNEYNYYYCVAAQLKGNWSSFAIVQHLRHIFLGRLGFSLCENVLNFCLASNLYFEIILETYPHLNLIDILAIFKFDYISHNQTNLLNLSQSYFGRWEAQSSWTTLSWYIPSETKASVPIFISVLNLRSQGDESVNAHFFIFFFIFFHRCFPEEEVQLNIPVQTWLPI